MKNISLLVCLLSSLMFISCEKDDHDDCHECHISLMDMDGSEHEHEIGEFCGDDLSDVESNGFTVTTAFSHKGVTYEVGHFFEASEVHCEEHAGHDDHDH